MNIAGLKQSNFLTRADVGSGVLVTIREVHQENVAKQGAPEELRWCLSFDEYEKPMVLNSTNGQIIASITKSDETDEWTGHKIVLYDDPNVSFGGKLVGGIRVRAQRKPNPPANAPKPSPAKPVTTAPQPRQQEVEQPSEDSDVPF